MLEQRAERANDYEYPGEPDKMVIERLRDVIELQAREIMRLQAVIRRLEQSPVGYVYEYNENVRADGAYQE